ncbi:MAG: EscF/YscF/HrpA family type III secretion system needle major subunit [Planctomycetota bacterium]|jgi:hypothetical protein|nr:EscF/YscF/HrpA family type III secretion system needle major subunit [Planctomycetota bacterium]
MSVNLSSLVKTGFSDKIQNMGTQVAQKINDVDPTNQVDLIKLQQEMAMYTNTLSMMSNITKNLADADKEIIRNT